MKDNLDDSMFSEIRNTLTGLYGEQADTLRYEYLFHKTEIYLKGRTESQVQINSRFDINKLYEDLNGKIFAIAYPDNVYTDDEYTLKTLSKSLKRFFPSIKGVHILPERTMSHGDVWPQDFFSLLPVDKSNTIISALTRLEIIDENRNVTDSYEDKIEQFANVDLKKIAGSKYDSTKEQVLFILDKAYNSHFNDGGFSQKTRAMVDPRFGENSDLIELTGQFSTMLDYVVNHLDVDNEYLEEFRKGNNEGDAFLIIYRDRYKQLIGDRILEKTFRPRPYPLFTGLRKYPVASLEGEKITLSSCAAEMNRIFTANELEPIDDRLILFLSIFFKIENDQGLTSEDKRIFSGFDYFTKENGIDTGSFWLKSEIQAKQKLFNPDVIDSMESFLRKMGINEKYADLFRNDCDHIFGREFYVYTTFSESQADVNPISFDGFKMIIDDLFHILSSGSLSMMRMDAIKYLWKEIGSKNFDMDEGNKLISVIRQLMQIASPSTLPLDEINSPDPVVYAMAKNGGFAYLFGQVNSVPVAFNIGDLQPVIRFNNTLQEMCPENLLRFVMLSTHDGRSVQGLGVQRSDGHVTIDQFYNLKDTVESRNGKPKLRSVTPGEISGDTFRKVFIEAGYEKSMNNLNSLFNNELISSEDIYRLKDQHMGESDLLEEISLLLKADVRTLMGSAAIDYFIQWIINGKTSYELCCTSRSAFTKTDSEGNSLTPEEEAQRLALAQLFVLTQGQDVPAIYFNDLLGLENDIAQFEITGKPRDLNRHKNKLVEMENLIENDPFTMVYVNKLNTLLKLRTEDRAFYPGSLKFQFKDLSKEVFMNHPWHSDNHSLILGNIVNRTVNIDLQVSQIDGFKGDRLEDQISGEKYMVENGNISIPMKPFGYIWLK